jgi:hypothetical protein
MCNSKKAHIKKVTIFLSLLFITAEVTAQDFKSYESGICIFNLQGCELTPPVERGIAFGISLILDTHKETFGFYFPDDYKVKVTIFTDRDEFLKYQKKQLGSIISNYGYYSGRHRETVALWETPSKKTEDAKEMVGLVFHEANHMILQHNIPWCPPWVNEGLSEYFDGLNVFGKNKRVFLNSDRSEWCKYWLEKGFPIKLDEYISLDYDGWTRLRKKDIDAAYAIGYSLVYFLMSRSNTEKVLKELLWEFKKEGKKADSIKVINENYPGGFAKFEMQWRKWIPKAKPYRPLRALRKQSNNLSNKPKKSSPDNKQIQEEQQ